MEAQSCLCEDLAIFLLLVMNPGIECRGLEQGSPRFKPET